MGYYAPYGVYTIAGSNIMKHERNIQLINELVDISEVIEIPFNNIKGPYKSFGLGRANISFVGYEKYGKFQDGLELLFNYEKDIPKTWTIKTFEDSLAGLIRKLRNDKIKCTTNDIENLFNAFLKEEIIEWEVLNELYGIEMSNPSIQFGPFIIYNYELSIEDLIKRYPYLSDKSLYFDHRNSNYLIGIKIKTREKNKAVEIADKYCELFENIFNYMIADLKHEHTLGVFNFRGWQRFDTITCYKTSIGKNLRSRIALPVKIENNFFKDSSQGNDKIWELITKNNKTEIEKRLLNSIEWIGKAINEIDLSKSLVNFVFAIECMLQYDEKAFITPSIVSQISDWLAFIIQDSPTERRKIAKYFKDIYKKRSIVAHGRSSEIDIEDVSIAMQISKHMIISFLTQKPFCEMKSMDELNNYLTDLKFK